MTKLGKRCMRVCQHYVELGTRVTTSINLVFLVCQGPHSKVTKVQPLIMGVPVTLKAFEIQSPAQLKDLETLMLVHVRAFGSKVLVHSKALGIINHLHLQEVVRIRTKVHSLDGRAIQDQGV
jgi:hypothetical protein